MTVLNLSDLRTYTSKVYENIPDTIRAHKWSFIFIGVSLVHTLIALTFTGKLEYLSDAISSTISVIGIFFAFYILPILVVAYLHTLIRVRPKKPLAYIWQKICAVFANYSAIASFVVIIIAFAVFSVSISYSKSTIPLLIPFAYDALFAEWDKIMFAGYYPHEVFNFLYDIPAAMFVLEINYKIWLWAFSFSISYCAFNIAGARLARVYILTCVLCWYFAGNVIATIASSAGPAFPELHNLDIYNQALIQLRDSFPIIRSPAHRVQELLLTTYQDANISLISAFPSLHVTIATALWLFSRQLGKRIAMLGTIFFALVVLGSFVLLWHYAVDAVAGIIIAVICWKVANWLIPADQTT